MLGKNPRTLFWGIVILLLVIVSFPFLYAAQAAGPDHVFGGFLFNPIDGNSYLAKTRQGLNGSWLFTLPYTPQPGEGAFLFVFYLALGHLARILNWSLLFTFHFFRLLGTVLLAFSLYRFCTAVFSSARTRLLAFSLATFGSGIGWLAFSFGAFTSDFWVAEAYPFLSAYANPHFAIGLAIQLWLLTPRDSSSMYWRYGVQYALAALLLAEIAPFAIPVVIAVYGGLLIWKLIAKENFKNDLARIFWIGLGSGPILLYDLWVIYTHPVLSGWNAQNLTPSPPIWDLFISIFPAIVLAVIAARSAWKSSQPGHRLLVVWLVVCFVLLYIPFNLQRRFLAGFFVPVALLAAMGLEQLAGGNIRHYRRYIIALFTFAIPTNLVILMTALFAIQTHDSQVYLSTEEVEAFTWINANLAEETLILASPDTGLYLPAYTHAKVVYGHPFETLNAERQGAGIISFFSEWDSEKNARYLADSQVDYIFIGPRERELGIVAVQDTWQSVYESQGVELYALND